MEDSFRIFAENGITHVRVTFYWESWELNRDRCLEDLSVIADSVEKYGIMCIYDNHQWECSPWIGYGIGMPNSVISKYYEMRPADSKPNYDIKKDFWDRWWNRKIKKVNDKDGWFRTQSCSTLEVPLLLFQPYGLVSSSLSA
jgi:hypothetical protein